MNWNTSVRQSPSTGHLAAEMPAISRTAAVQQWPVQYRAGQTPVLSWCCNTSHCHTVTLSHWQTSNDVMMSFIRLPLVMSVYCVFTTVQVTAEPSPGGVMILSSHRQSQSPLLDFIKNENLYKKGVTASLTFVTFLSFCLVGTVK